MPLSTVWLFHGPAHTIKPLANRPQPQHDCDVVVTNTSRPSRCPSQHDPSVPVQFPHRLPFLADALHPVSLVTLLDGHLRERTGPLWFTNPLFSRFSNRPSLSLLSVLVPVRRLALSAPDRPSRTPEAPVFITTLAMFDFHASSMHQPCTPMIDFFRFHRSQIKGRHRVYAPHGRTSWQPKRDRGAI